MSPKAPKTERRKKSRNRPPSLIYVELGAGNGGMIRDLSAEGFAVRAMMPLRAGEKTPFSFSLNDSVQIAGEGEILWVEENGRVAGIRFIEIPAKAHEEIDAWLNGKLVSRKDREAAEKSANSPAPSLAQLRQEIRNGPVGGETAGAARPAPPVPTQEAIANTPEPAVSMDRTERVSTEAPAPALRHSLPTAIAKPLVDSRAMQSAPPASAAFSPALKPEAIGPIDGPLLPPLGLPDISEVLIQPRGRQAMDSRNPVLLEPIVEVEPEAGSARANWMEWFTLSRVITMMVSLALIVGVSAFHRTVGGVLISLGEAMGGRPVSQVSPATANDTAPNNTASAPSSTPPEQSAENRDNASQAAATNDNGQPLDSSPANATPPVTPLPGISLPSDSGAGQETGQVEYLRAMQLLRGKSANTDMPMVVRLLWISVQKGNPIAEVALADLFWHGQGVAHNCDQARILLGAAARKGSAEAQKHLQQFQREGCE